MDDYISREAAVAAMTALRQEDIEAFGMVIPECFPSTSAIKALNKIPAADVIPIDFIKDQIRICEAIAAPTCRSVLQQLICNYRYSIEKR